MHDGNERTNDINPIATMSLETCQHGRPSLSGLQIRAWHARSRFAMNKQINNEVLNAHREGDNEER